MPTLAASVPHCGPALDASIPCSSAVKAPARSERELVALAREGDRNAFHRLFSLHEKHVYAICFWLLENALEAESLTQEIFLNAFRRLKGLRDDAAFSILISRSLWEVVLRFKCTPQETLSSSVQLAASNFQAASAALTQLES